MARKMLRLATRRAPRFHSRSWIAPLHFQCRCLWIYRQEVVDNRNFLQTTRRAINLKRSMSGKTAGLPVCSLVMQHLFPDKFHTSVPAMPCQAFVQHEHVDKEVRVPHVFSAIHQLVDCREWIKDPAALAEAKKEAEGLIAEGTWNYDEIVPRSELVAEARENGKKIHIGQFCVCVCVVDQGALGPVTTQWLLRPEGLRGQPRPPHPCLMHHPALRGPAPPTRKSKIYSIRRVGWNTWQDSPHH